MWLDWFRMWKRKTGTLSMGELEAGLPRPCVSRCLPPRVWCSRVTHEAAQVVQVAAGVRACEVQRDLEPAASFPQAFSSRRGH